jgi:hypothetical protein
LGEAVGLGSLFGEGRGGGVEERHGSELMVVDGFQIVGKYLTCESFVGEDGIWL